MNKKYLGLIAIWFACLAIGFLTNKTYTGIGVVFILIDFVRNLSDR